MSFFSKKKKMQSNGMQNFVEIFTADFYCYDTNTQEARGKIPVDLPWESSQIHLEFIERLHVYFFIMLTICKPKEQDLMCAKSLRLNIINSISFNSKA